MKKVLLYFVVLCLICLCSCSRSQTNQDTTHCFYYLQNTPTYGTNGSLIGKESRNLPDLNGEITDILQVYLQGPQSDTFAQTFPSDLTIVRFHIYESTAELVLGGSYDSITGLDRTFICACLTLTVCDLTGAKQVSIRSEADVISGAKPIIMTPQSITLLDTSKNEVETD